MRRSAEHFPKTPLLLSSVAFTPEVASLLGTIRASSGYLPGIMLVQQGYHQGSLFWLQNTEGEPLVRSWLGANTSTRIQNQKILVLTKLAYIHARCTK